MSTVKLSDLRRQASERGYSIWKVHPSTREFWEFGPYALITDDDNSIGLHGVGIEELTAFLDNETELGETR
jgi:hypothetical protein